MPHPSLPQSAQGWQYWTTEAGGPVPVLNPQVPPWDPRSIVAAPAEVFAASAEAFAGPATSAGTAAEGAAAQRGAMLTFLAGVACFLIGAGSAIAANRSSGGGLIWTGGMIVGVVLFWRAWRSHRAVRGLVTQGFPAGRLIVGLGAAACVGLGVTALIQFGEASEVGGASGSCWDDTTGGMLQEVSCDGDHQYRVTSWETDPDSCPMSAEFYVEVEDTDANYGCLQDDPA